MVLHVLKKKEDHTDQNKARTYFDHHPKFQYEKQLGAGVYGYAMLVSERTNNAPQRCVVKRALPPHQGASRNEIEILRSLRGAAHIVELLAYTRGDERGGGPATKTGRGTLSTPQIGGGTPRQPDWHSIGPGLAGPTMVLQYAPNGTLAHLVHRCYVSGTPIPNRVRWSFFLCRKWQPGLLFTIGS